MDVFVLPTHPYGLSATDTLVANNQASDDNVNPLFDQLTTALTVATDALGVLGAGGLTDLAKRQGDDEIAATSAEIVKASLLPTFA